MSQDKVRLITWREIPGNKCRRALNPNMFSEGKFYAVSSIKRIGDTEKTKFEIEYDKDYGLYFLRQKVCDPLEELGEEKVIELIKEAFEQDNKYNS